MEWVLNETGGAEGGSTLTLISGMWVCEGWDNATDRKIKQIRLNVRWSVVVVGPENAR
jgi:hypothetical protein